MCVCVCVRVCVRVCTCVRVCACSLAIAVHLTIPHHHFVYLNVSSSVCPYFLGRVQYSVMARTYVTVLTAAETVGLIPVGGREFLEASP